MLKSVCAIFLSMLACISSAEDKTVWTWVLVSSLPNDWVTLKGSAHVLIDNGKITAELFDAEKTEFLRYTLKGTINDEKVVIKIANKNSDYSLLSPYTGKYSKKTWDRFADSSGRETISATDGWNYLGLTREID